MNRASLALFALMICSALSWAESNVVLRTPGDEGGGGGRGREGGRGGRLCRLGRVGGGGRRDHAREAAPARAGQGEAAGAGGEGGFLAGDQGRRVDVHLDDVPRAGGFFQKGGRFVW